MGTTDYIQPNHGSESAPGDEYETIGDWATALGDRLQEVKLENTDEDRILRETFRHNHEYDAYPEWPIPEFLGELESFLDENIEVSPEYQDTLIGESSVKARLICWGVVGG